ncbi:hypothetical protein N7513_008188 [Penicillium frequentans]|nr:hypothetical protein N7513_008188 [Penicillium glabrum]
MRSLSPALASLANVFRIPMSLAPPCNPRPSHRQAQWPSVQDVPEQTSESLLFATSSTTPLTPRPLRFSRNRFLRHWTIHRTWQLFQAKQRQNHELELQRQYQSMQAACEELRTGAGDGGRLFRKSMNKKGIFNDMFPIEYGRMQTDYPLLKGGTMSGRSRRRNRFPSIVCVDSVRFEAIA